MKKEIKIPDIAENVDSGVIGRILVSKGDEVKKDQPVVEVETDKAATDIPSPFDGTIDEIKVEEGDEVTVGQVIMIVEVAGEGGAEEDGQPDDGEAEQKGQEDGKKKSSGEEQDADDDKDAGDDKDPGEEDEADREDEDSADGGDESDGGDSSDTKDKSGEEDAADESGEGDEEEQEDDGADDSDDEGADESDDDVKKKKAAEKEAQEKSSGDGKDSDQEDEQEEGDAKGKAASGKKTAAEDIPAAPSVRRMAREAGIDLSEVEGTGPGKRITAEDIQSAKRGKDEKKGKDETAEEGKKKEGKKDAGKQSKEGAPAREGAIELPDFSQWGATKKEKMNTVRRITARTMTASWQQIPQVTQFDEADITEIEAFRQKHKERYEKKGGKLTVTAILLKIAAYALQKFPRFNSSIDTSDYTLVMKQYINIGIAVDTERGLMVPVIRDTDKKSLEQISVETVELAKKARENEISLDALQGGNFTISNLGGIGGTGFTPIVYAPQVAILGVSRASYKQVFVEDKFQQRLVLPLTLTYDHRVIDGAEGARFLRWICDVLEDPYALLQ